jgi:hypothetical protein
VLLGPNQPPLTNAVYGVGEEREHQPFEYVRDLVTTEPNRCLRNQESETHHKPVGVDSRQHFSCIRHTGEVRRDVNRVGSEQDHDEDA